MSRHHCSENDVCDECHAAHKRKWALRAGGHECEGHCGKLLTKADPDKCEECRLESGESKWCGCGNAVIDADETDCEECAKSCGYECDCDSRSKHDAAMAEYEREFLRNPGPPPAHWDEDTVDRVGASINRARVAQGMEPMGSFEFVKQHLGYGK